MLKGVKIFFAFIRTVLNEIWYFNVSGQLMTKCVGGKVGKLGKKKLSEIMPYVIQCLKPIRLLNMLQDLWSFTILALCSQLWSDPLSPNTTDTKLNKFIPDLLVFVPYSPLEVCFNKSQLDQRLGGEICIDLWSGLEMFFLGFSFIYLFNHYFIRQVN